MYNVQNGKKQTSSDYGTSVFVSFFIQSQVVDFYLYLLHVKLLVKD